MSKKKKQSYPDVVYVEGSEEEGFVLGTALMDVLVDDGPTDFAVYRFERQGTARKLAEEQ